MILYSNSYMPDKKFEEDLNRLLFRMNQTKITKPTRFKPSTIKNKPKNDIEKIIASIKKL